MKFSDDLRPEERDTLQRLDGLPIDLEAMAVVSNIWRASQAIKLKQERAILREFDLTWASFSALFIIWIWGPAETRDIARLQAVTRPTVTSNVSMLERRGLCVRRASEQDKRLVIVQLTVKGEKTIKRVFRRFNQGEQAIASVLTPAERQTLARLLRKVVAGINAADNKYSQRV
jgi:DNA-binding MarR family transcriptional regulator